MYAKGIKALELAARGLRVFPCNVDNPSLTYEEIKRPAVGNWQKRATTNPDQIRKWWSQANFNIGVATGPGGNIIVLDFDMKEGQRGLASLKELEAKGLPQSYRVRTPSGGVHVYLTVSDGVFVHNSVSALAPNVDVRGNAAGGYVLGEGSTIHGEPYVRTLDMR